jgi:hypothetical protein
MSRLILTSTLIVLANCLISANADPGTLRESTDCYSSDSVTSLDEPEPALKSWFADCKTRIKNVMDKETKLAVGLKARIICTFLVATNGSISQLTFRATSGSQDNDNCTLEIIRKAAPFANLPDRIHGPKRVAVELGSPEIKMWQLN